MIPSYVSALPNGTEKVRPLLSTEMLNLSLMS